MSKENILKEFEERFTFTSDDLSEDETKILGTIKCFHQETSPNEVKQFLSKSIDQTREETIKEEIKYWKGVFDNRPKDRDLESDNIAQNFARIEIERLQSLINLLK
jgi:hypothetical protein